jgi:hypothetical protein
VGFIDIEGDAAGSTGFIDDEESVCLYVVVAVAVVSTCLGVLDAESSVCLGVLDIEDVPVAVPDAVAVPDVVAVIVPVAVPVAVLDVVAVSDVVAVTSACLGVLDANVCFGEAVEDSILLIIGLVKVGIAFGDALTVLVIEY